jgi:hypothetical protein
MSARPTTAHRPKHFSMIREFLVADLFTLANADLAQAATRKPQLEEELSGVFELRAETR